MKPYKLTYKRFNETSILIEWPQKIKEAILNDILNFKLKIEAHFASDIQCVTNAYASLLVNFKSYITSEAEILETLKTLYVSEGETINQTKTLWTIPVCYDESFGIDLQLLSKDKNISIPEIINRHTAPIYTVYFTGFLPGFLYLGGLDETLFFPRKATPRQQILKGSVAIGGKQTGIYPTTSPAGWNIIGNLPIQLFNTECQPPCFIKSGDNIKFKAIDLDVYNAIVEQIENSTFKIESEVLDG